MKYCPLQDLFLFKSISIIDAYTPTELAEDNEKDHFYEQLELAYDRSPRRRRSSKYDVNIVIGNFNTKIGREET